MVAGTRQNSWKIFIKFSLYKPKSLFFFITLQYGFNGKKINGKEWRHEGTRGEKMPG